MGNRLKILVVSYRQQPDLVHEGAGLVLKLRFRVSRMSLVVLVIVHNFKILLCTLKSLAELPTLEGTLLLPQRGKKSCYRFRAKE